MSRAFVNENAAGTPLVRSSKDAAERMAEVYRGIEPDFRFEPREGRSGWMIARLNKDGSFDSWVEE